ncbi:uncharacterized protein N7443_009352 [Penicillium atrosanguineum]|uniref:Uncharacterized protein n=1 Tax=Penicillium atrosanguineum TaxID=1132637 RepID=A0A9W9PQ32_9EURO|nr:uncharacterized protein N7443_009352 [Penicillium atrosanguineum]KAJ5126308.1 hypothetical protein N7526_008485 [Penicillium atrosanguineum]KAJ5293399.1 hypothetical protein N7443_009352 [Penicillium atrosanguineum]KAJ5302567.1 hypothetical protein N7476_009366 [Penicillium atrosanguineum]
MAIEPISAKIRAAQGAGRHRQGSGEEDRERQFARQPDSSIPEKQERANLLRLRSRKYAVSNPSTSYGLISNKE